jgi:predicted nucleic acid-binding protein
MKLIFTEKSWDDYLYWQKSDKQIVKKINRILSQIKLVDIDQSTLNFSDGLIEEYSLKQNMGIYDAIIAATCLVYDLPLWIYNKKDFRFINELELIK